MTAAVDGQGWRISAAGDSAVVLEFPARIDVELNQRVTAIADQLRARWGAILRDVVVGYCTVTVYFNPLSVDAAWLEFEMHSVAVQSGDSREAQGRFIEVPVCYDGDLALDLADVAAFGGCTTEEVISLHTGGRYRVYLVGFVPGFAYLAEVDPRIAAPRRPTPRTAVPAGSVGIAGAQTGIYPRETPGGWNIIGRTLLRPYDPARAEPFLFHAGDTVQFVRISREEFDQTP